jgi:hypothetical protein
MYFNNGSKYQVTKTSHFMISFLEVNSQSQTSYMLTHSSNSQGSWGSVVTYMAIKLQAGQLRNYHLIPSNGKILYSPTRPLLNEYQGHAANHSPPSSTKIKNEWYYTTTHLCVFMASTRTLALLTSAVHQDCPYMGSSIQNLTAMHHT